METPTSSPLRSIPEIPFPPDDLQVPPLLPLPTLWLPFSRLPPPASEPRAALPALLLTADACDPTTRPTPASRPAPPLPPDLPELDDGPTPPPPPPPRRPSAGKPPTTQAKILVTLLELKGLQRFSETDVRRKIFLQEGDFFSQANLDKDLQRLRKSGLFEKVEAKVKIEQGLAEIVFLFTEKALIYIQAIFFRGNKILPEADLQKKTRFKVGDFLEQERLQEDAQKILAAYHELGYFRARLYVQGQWGGTEKRKTVQLIFVIEEGVAAKVRSVEVFGVSPERRKELVGLLDTQPSSWETAITGKGIFHPYYVSRDRYILGEYYANRGYLEAKVSGPRLMASPDRLSVHLAYTIDEGPVYRYGSISLAGDILGKPGEIQALVKAKTGDIFNRSLLFEGTIYPMRTRYRDAGYAQVEIRPIPFVDQKRLRMGLQLVIEKGPRTTFERILIQGLSATSEALVRRRLVVKEGDLFSESKIRQSQLRIFSLGMFEKTDERYGVQTQVQRGSREDTILLIFALRERSTWGLNPGFTFFPGVGFLLGGRYSESNFLGLGQTLVINATLSTTMRVWSVSLQFAEPRLVGTDISLLAGADISYSAFPGLGFATDRLGLNVAFGFPLGLPWLRLSLSYLLGRFSLTPQEDFVLRIQGFTEGRWLRSGFQAFLAWDDRAKGDAFFRMYHFASFRHIARYFGSDYSANDLQAGVRFYLPLPLKSVFRIAATLQWVFSFEPTGLPPFERLRLGGNFDLRGFAIQSIAPSRRAPSLTDASFRPVPLNWGGSKSVMLNAELEIPLLAGGTLSLVGFFDAGNVFDDHENLFQDTRTANLPGSLFMNVGFGIRLRTPNAGLLRLELGFPLTPRPGDPGVLFWLTLGETIF